MVGKKHRPSDKGQNREKTLRLEVRIKVIQIREMAGGDAKNALKNALDI